MRLVDGHRPENKLHKKLGNSFSNKIFILFLMILFYIVEKDACPCELPISVRRFEEWRKTDEINASNLFRNRGILNLTTSIRSI